MSIEDRMAEVARQCEYNDGAGFPDEGEESGVESLIEYKNALEDLVLSNKFDFRTVTDETEGGAPLIVFEPWTDGHAVGFKVTQVMTRAVRYVYLNPSTETWSDGQINPDVFVYEGPQGGPDQDIPYHFYNIGFDGIEPSKEEAV